MKKNFVTAGIVRPVIHIILILLLSLATIMQGGFIYEAFAASNIPVCEPFMVSLSETDKIVKSVTAEVEITSMTHYDDLRGVTKQPIYYYWDCAKGSGASTTGNRYTITTPGKHYVNIYAPRGNSHYLYGTIEFNVNNIDIAAPNIGSINAEVSEGKWLVTIESCTDNITAPGNIRYACLEESKAKGYRSSGGWDISRLLTECSWGSSMSYTLDEGSYCFFAKDEIGNVAERDFNTGHIDVEPPFFKEEPSMENEGDVNGFARAVLISVDAEDDEDGSGLNDYPYSFNNGETWQQGNQFRVTGNGTVNILVRDRMGNMSEVKTIEVINIDNDAPTISISGQDETAGDGTVELNVSASDGLSGVSEISYQNDEVGVPIVIAGGDGSSSPDLSSRVTINNNGTYTFFVKDLMGNLNYEKVNVVRAVKTEYRDVEKEKNKDSDKDKNKDSNKDKDKNDNGDKETRIINPGNTPAGDNPTGDLGDKKIVIKDGDGNTADNESSKDSNKSRTVSSGVIGGSRESVKMRNGNYEPLEGDELNSEEDDSEEDDEEENEVTEIREMTLDEYLSGAPDKGQSEEELLPELLNEDKEEKENKGSRAGKIAMAALILIVLAALTVFLLIKKGIISLPENDAEDIEEDCDSETGVLSIADRLLGVFKRI